MAASPLRSKEGFEHLDTEIRIVDATGIDLTTTGLSAVAGSIAQKTDGTVWRKFGGGLTDWTEIAVDSVTINALSAAISGNTVNITTLSGDLESLSAQVITNTTNIATISGDVITNTTNIATISGDVITNTTNIATISGDLSSLSSQFVNHQHLKADITDFNESDYVHTTGAESISGVKTFHNDMIVNGNLTVNGTTTTVSSETVLVTDNIITLNNGEPGAGVTALSAGIEVDRGSLATVTLRWNEITDTWQVTEDGTVYYDILHNGNSSFVGILSAGNYVLGNDVASDLIILDNNLFTVSGDLDTLEATVSTLSAATIISGNTVAEDLLALDQAIDAIESPVGISVDGVGATATTIDSVLVDDVGAVKWLLTYVDEANDKRNASEVWAVHDGQTDADAANVDFTDYAFIKAPAALIPGVTINVDLAGTGVTQTMRLRLSSSSVTVNVRATKIEVST